MLGFLLCCCPALTVGTDHQGHRTLLEAGYTESCDQWRDSPIDTLSCCEDELVVDQGASTDQIVLVDQCRVPRPRPRRSADTTYNRGVDLRDTAN